MNIMCGTYLKDPLGKGVLEELDFIGRRWM